MENEDKRKVVFTVGPYAKGYLEDLMKDLYEKKEPTVFYTPIMGQWAHDELNRLMMEEFKAINPTPPQIGIIGASSGALEAAKAHSLRMLGYKIRRGSRYAENVALRLAANSLPYSAIIPPKMGILDIPPAFSLKNRNGRTVFAYKKEDLANFGMTELQKVIHYHRKTIAFRKFKKKP